MKNEETTEINREEFLIRMREIEEKWQKIWEDQGIFHAEYDSSRPKFFCNFPYPYVNGSVHVGHGYSAMKIEMLARYKRMQGFNVLFPQAFHATGEPIVGAAKRLKEGDEIQKRVLIEFGVDEKDLEKFEDPEYIVHFFIKKMEKDMRAVGLSIDWRRKFVTTTLTPVYSKFVEWQYKKLYQKGYVTQGSHPVIWCPSCESPTGDHDRLEGEGKTITDFSLIKFPFQNVFLVPATLRPVNVYGVTNMFLDPEIEYKKIKLKNGEQWIVCKEAIPKLQDQEITIEEVEDFQVSDLWGKTCLNQVTMEEVPILPANFIDKDVGTGVVMAVPSQAPVDWLTLKRMQEHPEDYHSFGISDKQLRQIKPINMLEIEGYGEFHAIEIVEKMKIEDLEDERLDQATKLAYRKEFHDGKLVISDERWNGKRIAEISDEIIKDFRERGFLETLREPEATVVCRCGTRNHVKYLQNQWFLDYGNKKWKERVQKHLNEMKVYPEEGRSSFDYTINWLQERACARRSGLGTPLPWDPEWIVETLSDSTIYMSYYTISHFVNAGLVTGENAIPELFDYIFLGEGDLTEVAERSKLDQAIISQMKEEFEYWYPFDVRGSGKDLIMNHLTFCLFQHKAIFPDDKQPNGILVNGMMTYQGEAMSKSRGVFTPLSTAVQIYSADLIRGGLLAAGEGINDTNLNENEVLGQIRWLQILQGYIQDIKELENDQVDEKETHEDLWLISRMQERIKKAIDAYENIQTRTVVLETLYGMIKDIKWYLRRTVGRKGKVFRRVVINTLLLVTPIFPHFCEEMWQYLGKEGTIIFEKFPDYDESQINEEALKIEEAIENLINDINKIIKALGKKVVSEAKELRLYVAADWKYKVYEMQRSGKQNIQQELMKDSHLRKKGKEISKFLQKIKRDHSSLSPIMEKQEFTRVLDESKIFLEERYGKNTLVFDEDQAIEVRARNAYPDRVAIQFV